MRDKVEKKKTQIEIYLKNGFVKEPKPTKNVNKPQRPLMTRSALY